jgi:two-component sensor histidine kinase
MNRLLLEFRSVRADGSLWRAYLDRAAASNMDRLRLVSWLALIIFAALATQHLLIPGMERGLEYHLYLVIYAWFLVCFGSFILAGRLLSRAEARRPLQIALVLALALGGVALGVLDTAVNVDASSLLIALIIVSSFYRSGYGAIAAITLCSVAAYVAGCHLFAPSLVGVNTYVNASVFLFVSNALALAFSLYDRQNFMLTERLSRANESLQAELGAREVMFKELQHRVKNSLGMAASLLSLDERGVADQEAKGCMRAARERIETIAAVYELLYESREIADVDLAAYLRKLVESIKEANKAALGAVRVEASLETVRTSSRKAIYVGLIANELITNSLKHAFPQGRGGSISIALSAIGGKARFSVRDDGVGMAEGQDASLGGKIVGLLAQQLDSAARRLEGPGYGLELEFEA